MGLDMYLNRMPRYKNVTVREVIALENYFEWREKKRDPNSSAKECSLKEWCGIEQKNVPKGDIRKFYEKFYTIKYSHWDTEHKYGYGSIIEQIGYWRKANHIHNWFVNNVQDGEDDCQYHNEVTKEMLEELLDTCQTVLDSCELVSGQIENGYSFDDKGNRVYNYMDGLIVKDPSVAMDLLPTQSGFFFGDTDYDEYYVDSIKETIDIITMALETTDFDKEMIYYVSSW